MTKKEQYVMENWSLLFTVLITLFFEVIMIIELYGSFTIEQIVIWNILAFINVIALSVLIARYFSK